MAMVKRLCFEKICGLAAAASCYNSGATVKEIATQAGVSTKTVYSWLRSTHTQLRRNRRG